VSSIFNQAQIGKKFSSISEKENWRKTGILLFSAIFVKKITVASRYKNE
jgi:hypothetical protein